MKTCDKPEWEHCYHAIWIEDDGQVTTECHMSDDEICPFEDQDE